MTDKTSHRYTAGPTEARDAWIVYRVGQVPCCPLFLGTMEDAGLVADALNARSAPR